MRDRAVALLRLCALVGAMVPFAPPALAQVLVVLSDDSPVYRQVADELESALAPLRERRLRIDVVNAAQASAAIDGNPSSGYELVMTVGLAAAQAVAAGQPASIASPPTLCLLIQKRSFDALASQAPARGQRLSAVFLEQPIARQLDLIALALPGKTRIGAIFGPTSSALAPELAEGARKHGFELERVDVDDARELYGAMRKILPRSDLVLAIPDPVALNASTARDFLLTSYRAQVPVVGFSQAFVDAGAVVAVYSTPRQQARQGAEIAARVLSGDGALPAPYYPRYFTVGVNFFAARSLGLAIENEAALASALAERGNEPAHARDAPPSAGPDSSIPKGRGGAAHGKGP